MRNEELIDLAVKLDHASGFPELTAEQSWCAEFTLGPHRYHMHKAAMELYAAANYPEPTHGLCSHLAALRTRNRIRAR